MMHAMLSMCIQARLSLNALPAVIVAMMGEERAPKSGHSQPLFMILLPVETQCAGTNSPPHSFYVHTLPGRAIFLFFVCLPVSLAHPCRALQHHLPHLGPMCPYQVQALLGLLDKDKMEVYEVDVARDVLALVRGSMPGLQLLPRHAAQLSVCSVPYAHASCTNPAASMHEKSLRAWKCVLHAKTPSINIQAQALMDAWMLQHTHAGDAKGCSSTSAEDPSSVLTHGTGISQHLVACRVTFSLFDAHVQHHLCRCT